MNPRVKWWSTSVGKEEVERIALAISKGQVSQGAVTVEFETKLAEAIGASYAVVTTSGSVALLLALWANGIGRDDEVIVPNRTFAATAHAAMILGAKIVLVDVVSDAPIIDATTIESAITPRTKAIMPVQLNGRSSDMRAISALAKKHGLKVVEDAAQALFSKNADGFLGTQSDAGAYSLGMTKLLQTGQGGAVATNSKAVFEELKLLRNHGVGGDSFSVEYGRLGCNFKFTDIQAAIGVVQLGRMKERIQRLNEIYRQYDAGIAGLSTVRMLPVNLSVGEVPLYVEVLSPTRAHFMSYLEGKGVETRKSLPSLHRSPHISTKGGDFPCSTLFEDQSMYLPCGPGQTTEGIAQVIEAVHAYRA